VPQKPPVYPPPRFAAPDRPRAAHLQRALGRSVQKQSQEPPEGNRRQAPHVAAAMAVTPSKAPSGPNPRPPAGPKERALAVQPKARILPALSAVIQRAAAATSQFWHCTFCNEEFDYGGDFAEAAMPSWSCANGHNNWIAGPAPVAPAPVIVQAPVHFVNDGGLVSSCYTHNGIRWNHKTGPEKPEGFHAEREAYRRLSVGQRVGWIGFEQNGAPCPACRTYFENASKSTSISGFMFYITEDKGGYSAYYGGSVPPYYIYIVNGVTTYGGARPGGMPAPW